MYMKAHFFPSLSSPDLSPNKDACLYTVAQYCSPKKPMSGNHDLGHKCNRALYMYVVQCNDNNYSTQVYKHLLTSLCWIIFFLSASCSLSISSCCCLCFSNSACRFCSASSFALCLLSSSNASFLSLSSFSFFNFSCNSMRLLSSSKRPFSKLSFRLSSKVTVNKNKLFLLEIKGTIIQWDCKIHESSTRSLACLRK